LTLPRGILPLDTVDVAKNNIILSQRGKFQNSKSFTLSPESEKPPLSIPKASQSWPPLNLPPSASSHFKALSLPPLLNLALSQSRSVSASSALSLSALSLSLRSLSAFFV